MTEEELIAGIQTADKIIEENSEIYDKKVFEELNILQTQEDNFKDKTINKLGASEIGNKCARALYYSYHKEPRKKPESRLVRLFNRGKLEEARIIAYLRLMGLDVLPTDNEGRQFFFKDFDDHFQGHCDGLIFHNNEYILLEMKTMNDKSFTKTDDKGVAEAHPIYYTQMQVYMGYFGIKQALFVSANKNNDDLYFELVNYDKIEYSSILTKVNDIITCQNIDELPRISTLPSYFECRWCPYRGVCYGV